MLRQTAPRVWIACVASAIALCWTDAALSAEIYPWKPGTKLFVQNKCDHAISVAVAVWYGKEEGYGPEHHVLSTSIHSKGFWMLKANEALEVTQIQWVRDVSKHRRTGYRREGGVMLYVCAVHNRDARQVIEVPAVSYFYYSEPKKRWVERPYTLKPVSLPCNASKAYSTSMDASGDRAPGHPIWRTKAGEQGLVMRGFYGFPVTIKKGFSDSTHHSIVFAE